jgi:hypothetical protein
MTAESALAAEPARDVTPPAVNEDSLPALSLITDDATAALLRLRRHQDPLGLIQLRIALFAVRAPWSKARVD